MECIACTQCIDACDQVMDRIGSPGASSATPRRTSWRASLAAAPSPRGDLPADPAAVFGALGISLARRTSADVTVLRGSARPTP